MPFCSNCGASVEGNFCSACGQSVAGAPPAGEVTPLPSTTPAGALQDNVAGALCYLLGCVTGVLFLVLQPYDRNREVRFHAFQSIFFNIAVIVIALCIPILGAVLGVIPFLGHLMIALISTVFWLGSVGLWIVLMIKTYSGSRMVLPVIGSLAQKQAG